MIVVRIWEGLGNQLFQYAYARALQMRTEQKVYLDISEYANGVLRKYGLNHFKITIPTIKSGQTLFNAIDYHDAYNIIKVNDKAIKYGFPISFGKEENINYKKALLVPNGNWYLKGWYQNENYFKEYYSLICRELKPKNKIRISSELHQLLKKEETISVHFRRGDYQKTHNILDINYYLRAMKLVKKRIKNPRFIIFSDDIEWVKQNLNFIDECHYVNEQGTLQDYEELMIMSRCKHNIIANSTFSWWGAWLNQNEEKIVIAPKVWFPDNSHYKTDIVPQDWIKL